MTDKATRSAATAAAKRRSADARARKAGLKPDAPKLPARTPVAAAAQEALQAPAVLLPYQQRWVADQATLKVAGKGRRVGLTWAEAADDVLIAAAMGGSNVFYISANEDMAREYIEAVGMWAKHFSQAASEVADGIYDDSDDGAAERRYIKTFEVTFPLSGKRIVALSSRPSNLRGKQGVVVIDEAAYAPDLDKLLKAAMAMVLWGDRVRIISTHDGADNPFAELIDEVRAGKRGTVGVDQDASVHHIPFSLAVAEGLYKRVCLRQGKVWTQEAEDKWVAGAKAMYADNADEELEAIPAQGGGNYLALALITARMSPSTPIVRGRWDGAFVLLPDAVRRLAVKGWIAEQLDPILAQLNPLHRHRFGWDFARVADLSVLTITAQDGALNRRTVLVVELANCPFAHQEQILWHIIDRLPRFSGGAMDAGGNGAQVAENTALRYGMQLVHQVKLSQAWYVEHMPKLKAALEDGTLTDIPRDEHLQSDLRAVKVTRGVPQVANRVQTKDADGVKLQRHGDFAIAAVMECYIASADVGEIAWQSVPGKLGSAPPVGSAAAFFGRQADQDAYAGSMDGW
jgi:phage FluMu gp28-like protein